MTKFAIALAAAALLAAPSFSSSAEAGGVRLGFGFPLGSFVARPHQSYNATPSYHAHKRIAKKPAYVARAAKQEDAAVRKAHKPKVKVELADKAPVKRYRAPELVKTAKIENKSLVSDAAPTIRVPETATVTAVPAVTAATTEVTAVDGAPVTTQTAAVEPAQTVEVQQEVKVEEPKTEKIETVAKAEPKVSTSSKAQRVCRRFSAAIAGLIDIPCE